MLRLSSGRENMPKSIILFVWLACLAVAARLAPVAIDPRHDALAAIYGIAMVALRLAVIWLIVHRHSSLLRWGWIGFAFIGAGANAIHFVAQPGAIAAMPLLIAYYGLALASAAALLLPASWDWLSTEPRTWPA
jgi:hypothetical protein